MSSPSSSSSINTNTDSAAPLNRPTSILTPSNHLQLKLTKDNYLSWKTVIIPYINGNKILHHVDNDSAVPPQYIASPSSPTDLVLNPAYASWFEIDQLLLSVLMSTISESLVSSLVGLTSSRAVWLALEKMFSSQSRARIMTTRYSLATLKKGNLTITDYFQKAKACTDLLASIGEPISDSATTSYILAGLPHDYDSLIATVNTRVEAFPLDELYGHLLTHELRIDQQALSSPDITAPTANFAAKTSQPSQNCGHQFYSHNGRGRGRGRTNSSRGQGSPQFYSNNSGSSHAFCQICFKVGHTAQTCWHRFDQNFQVSSNQSPQAFAASTSSTVDPAWYPDTGANNHLTADYGHLNLHAEDYTGQDQVRIGNGQGLRIHHIGSSILCSSSKNFFLNNILHVPNISKNLLSVYQFAKDNNVFFEFHPSFFCVKDLSSGVTLLSGKSKNGLYPLHSLQRLIKPTALLGERVSVEQWHSRLGHPALRIVRQVLSSHHLPTSNNKTLPICHACQLGKSHRFSFSLSPSRSSFPLELIFTDVWGPSPTLSYNGNRYYVCFVDDFSKFIWLFPITSKSDVYNIFLKFQLFVERQFDRKIKCVQSDWGGEFRKLNTFFQSLGIRHRLPCPHTHHQNGSVERKHRHIVETGLTLLASASLPQKYWDDAFLTATYLINRLPSPVTSNKSPLELLFKQTPDYNFLKIFGCACWPHLRPYNTHKMDFRSTRCIFLGYSLNHKGYKCLDPTTNRIYIARNVVFDEHVFPFATSSPSTTTPLAPPSTIRLPNLPKPNHTSYPLPPLPKISPTKSPTLSPQISPPQISPPNSTQPSQILPTTSTSLSPQISSPQISLPNSIQPSLTDSASSNFHIPASSISHNESSPPTPTSPRVSTNISLQVPCDVTQAVLHPMQTRGKDNISKPKVFFPGIIKYPLPKALLATTDQESPEPTSYTAASKHPAWRAAMNTEFIALLHNGTWKLVPLKPTMNLVGCKWVFRIKRKADGSTDRYKARLVAKGFHQQPGIDYGETFSPVIKPVTIRIVLSLAVASNWDIRQLDVTNAFLHGVISEDVYMTQPPGFVHASYPNYVCHLHKALYGLKQAPRAWFSRLSNRLLQLGFHGCKSDTSLFIYKTKADTIFFLIYVDDIIVTGPNSSSINSLISKLQQDFAVKDLGPLNFFLGVEAIKANQGLYLSQRRYIHDLLRKTNMHEAKPISSPMASSTSLSQFQGTPLSDPSSYRSTVGSLQYLSLTRPDIAFAVNKVCQFMTKPTNLHWSAVKRILRYLKHTSHHSLFLHRNSNFTIQAFSDADWAGSPDDRRSTSGYCLFLGRNLISWSSRKQRTVSRSSTESEYRAIAHASAELVWLRSLLSELGVPSPSTPILWCDNIGATYLTANPLFHARTKHIEIDFHFVRDLVSSKTVSVQFISSKDQVADTFTKPLPTAQFISLRANLNVRDLPLRLRGRIETTTTQTVTAPPHQKQLMIITKDNQPMIISKDKHPSKES
jgi:hypothetical protein